MEACGHLLHLRSQVRREKGGAAAVFKGSTETQDHKSTGTRMVGLGDSPTLVISQDWHSDIQWGKEEHTGQQVAEAMGHGDRGTDNGA